MQKLAAKISHALGRESALVRALRPAYERVLDLSTGGRGIRRILNGRETFFIDPRSRGLFPEIYEPEVFHHLRSRVPPGACCLNIGAHVGIYALCLAEWAGPNGRVFAFEPNPETRRLLASNIARNPCGVRVEVVPQAVSSSEGHSDFFATAAEGYSRLGSANPQGPANAHKLRVATTSIDRFCSARGISPDCMVIDVEGYEGAVLAGARATITRSATPPLMVVEMHPHLWESAGASPAQIQALLAELRLSARALNRQSDIFCQAGAVELRRE